MFSCGNGVRRNKRLYRALGPSYGAGTLSKQSTHASRLRPGGRPLRSCGEEPSGLAVDSKCCEPRTVAKGNSLPSWVDIMPRIGPTSKRSNVVISSAFSRFRFGEFGMLRNHYDPVKFISSRSLKARCSDDGSIISWESSFSKSLREQSSQRLDFISKRGISSMDHEDVAGRSIK